MANIFEPAEPIGSFESKETEFQVTVDPVSPELHEFTTDELDEPEHRSFRLPLVGVVLLLLILSVRLINLQVTNGKTFQVLAEGNRIETRFLTAPRGTIVDRKGEVLAKNVPIYNLELYPARLPKEKDDREKIYQQVSQVSGIPTGDIVSAIDKYGLRSSEPIVLKSGIERDTALDWQVKLGAVSGVFVNQTPARSYLSLLSLSHILGYVGKVTSDELKERQDLTIDALIGKGGLELFYDQYLQGKPGKEEMEADSKGQIQRIVASEPATPGHTLKLYLDKELQQVMSDALAEGVTLAGRKKGVAIALDPQTGGVLGMVSLPAYDNNVFIDSQKKKERQSYLSDPDQPLFNRAVAGLYPPGSTSKPIWAVAGLEEKSIRENTSIQTPSEIRIGSSVFPDWKPHGNADVKKAIAESNNIFFYALGGGYDKIKGLGPTKMKEYGHRFGWGQPTKIDLPGEANGLIPDPDWKKKRKKENWYIGDSYHMAIGQGDLLLTPIQLIASIAAIANGGTLYEPRLVQDVRDVNEALIYDPGVKEVNKQIASSETLRIVREGMRQTVISGTARPLNELPIPVAGKTGTAQFEDKDRTHAWFVGFAPFDKPSVALLVMVEGGGESFTVAVPIAKKILAWYSEHALATGTPPAESLQ